VTSKIAAAVDSSEESRKIGNIRKEKAMKTSAKRLGMTILTILAMVLALVTVSAASAVWGS
jgi:hypothetical protein